MSGSPDASTTIELDGPLDLARTLRPVGHGRRDPSVRIVPGEVWRATITPDGLGTIRVRTTSPDVVRADAWGPGASWLLDRSPAMVGLLDDRTGFVPSQHPVVHDLDRRLSGVRMCRTARVLDALVPAILEQKVTGREARRAWAGLLVRFGDRAPGPLPLVAPPSAERLRTVTSSTWHRLGIERRRAETIARAAAVAHRLERAVDEGADVLDTRLRSIPGVGPWTSAEVRRVAVGDPDAVSVGDFHLPNAVAWALACEPRADDDRMLELLAPFAGHRGRVTMLIEAGAGHAPRRGPRMPLRDIARH